MCLLSQRTEVAVVGLLAEERFSWDVENWVEFLILKDGTRGLTVSIKLC
jgi:hypothetical protein